jgi:hypothetical protein
MRWVWERSVVKLGWSLAVADFEQTLQTISFLAHLRSKGTWGPFLIVCPLSVLNNWVMEFEKFAPTIPVCLDYPNATQLIPSPGNHVSRASRPPSGTTCNAHASSRCCWCRRNEERQRGTQIYWRNRFRRLKYNSFVPDHSDNVRDLYEGSEIFERVHVEVYRG